jgi:hypothetical protein
MRKALILQGEQKTRNGNLLTVIGVSDDADLIEEYIRKGVPVFVSFDYTDDHVEYYPSHPNAIKIGDHGFFEEGKFIVTEGYVFENSDYRWINGWG